jgi:hypothetical protein
MNHDQHFISACRPSGIPPTNGPVPSLITPRSPQTSSAVAAAVLDSNLIITYITALFS